MFRVLTAEFSHETNTFSIVPTTLESFQRGNLIVGDDKVVLHRRSTRTALGATIECAEKYNWTLVNTVCATATPSGKIVDSCYNHIADLIMAPLNISGPFDGIVLHLHGAMVTESLEDAEGELLRRLREKVGDIPIVVTLDLHGNITEMMARNASSLIAVRTYPHIDFYERAEHACEMLQYTMQKLIEPYTIIVQRPMLQGNHMFMIYASTYSKFFHVSHRIGRRKDAR